MKLDVKIFDFKVQKFHLVKNRREATMDNLENSIVVTIPLTRVSSEGITPVSTQVSTQVEGQILEFCENPKSMTEIGEMLGLKQRKSVRKYVIPLVEKGRLAMTIPDKPNSRFQKYIKIK